MGTLLFILLKSLGASIGRFMVTMRVRRRRSKLLMNLGAPAPLPAYCPRKVSPARVPALPGHGYDARPMLEVKASQQPRSAAVPAASSDGVPPFEDSRGGTLRELAGTDACAS